MNSIDLSLYNCLHMMLSKTLHTGRLQDLKAWKENREYNSLILAISAVADLLFLNNCYARFLSSKCNEDYYNTNNGDKF